MLNQGDCILHILLVNKSSADPDQKLTMLIQRFVFVCAVGCLCASFFSMEVFVFCLFVLVVFKELNTKLCAQWTAYAFFGSMDFLFIFFFRSFFKELKNNKIKRTNLIPA